MIRWHGLHNEYFHFQIVGYEFPQVTEGYDANWLMITMEAANEQGTWTRRCACLLTWEVTWLIHWLEQVVNGEAEPILSVSEVDLTFHSISISQGKLHPAQGLAPPSKSRSAKAMNATASAPVNNRFSTTIGSASSLRSAEPPGCSTARTGAAGS